MPVLLIIECTILIFTVQHHSFFTSETDITNTFTLIHETILQLKPSIKTPANFKYSIFLK